MSVSMRPISRERFMELPLLRVKDAIWEYINGKGEIELENVDVTDMNKVWCNLVAESRNLSLNGVLLKALEVYNSIDQCECNESDKVNSYRLRNFKGLTNELMERDKSNNLSSYGLDYLQREACKKLEDYRDRTLRIRKKHDDIEIEV